MKYGTTLETSETSVWLNFTRFECTFSSVCSGVSSGNVWAFLSGGKVGSSSLFVLSDLHSKRVKKMSDEEDDRLDVADSGNVPMILKLKPFTGVETTLKTSVVSTKRQKLTKHGGLDPARFTMLRNMFLNTRGAMIENYTQNECRFEVSRDISELLPFHLGAIRGLQCLG